MKYERIISVGDDRYTIQIIELGLKSLYIWVSELQSKDVNTLVGNLSNVRMDHLEIALPFIRDKHISSHIIGNDSADARSLSRRLSSMLNKQVLLSLNIADGKDGITLSELYRQLRYIITNDINCVRTDKDQSHEEPTKDQKA
ncbi:hypothetical protein GJ496_008181 [Pomphorhynchus laevis]|nr:hypothetical protein GJ496_008181 [Pomphorhynchus laevis]